MINERLKRLERILELTRMISADLDYSTILQTAISIASELTNSEIASILKYDEGDNHLHFVAAPWFHKDAVEGVRVPLEESIAGWVYVHAKPLVIQDVHGDERFYSEVDLAAEFQTYSILAVPLLVKGRAVGVFEALNKISRAHYNGEDVTILETLASLAALIVSNISLEERVEKTRVEAEKLEQMKNDFIAISSHELRTPLGLILGHSTFLREVIDEEHQEQLDTIIRSGAKLKEIIENMSNVKNFQSGAARLRMRKFSLANLLLDSINVFQEAAQEKKITLHPDIKTPELLLEGDAAKIEIAFSNLIKNALTFTPEGGHIFVVAEEIPGYAKVSVVDDGIGIPEKDLPHIFERFYQVESHLTRQHGGMGLGLSVAKVMIEMHSGEILVESVLDKGSRFTFLLPLDPNQIDAGQRVFHTKI
ncbi:MAG: GAF domain-containing protein [Anaerolineae bacterium]|jgi:signal transduction histidine kinase|nr:GAF domain-containing protein [Anaerolineae bacterium]MBT7070976.1 GAF domain-containing protein [Anaerolineae bacterium]MBT7325882.1 GAF domain-containing protein [Anaerolineae bacterium]